MVALFDVADARADAIDDAGPFVANNRGQVDRLVAAHGLPVGVAEAAGGDFDPDLAGAGLADFDLRYIQPALGGVEDGGLHFHPVLRLICGHQAAQVADGFGDGGGFLLDVLALVDDRQHAIVVDPL